MREDSKIQSEGKKYTTLKRAASAEFTEKKSVFIGHAAPVKSDTEALEFVRKIKEKYSDARHNVYAYYLRGGAMARFSDDGEPQGTAGAPVLEVIKKSGCDDCVVAVTRYFGGILLGAGGLTRAYSNAAAIALEAAEIVTLDEYSEYTLECSYPEYNKISFELNSAKAMIDNTDFFDNVILTYAVKTTDADRLNGKISELSGGKLCPKFVKNRFDYHK